MQYSIKTNLQHQRKINGGILVHKTNLLYVIGIYFALGDNISSLLRNISINNLLM